MTATKNPRRVQVHHLCARDFREAPDKTVIVTTSKASNFRVEEQRSGVYIVYGRTEFIGGQKVVTGIDNVRRLLVTR